MQLLINTGSSSVKLALARRGEIVARTSLPAQAGADELRAFLSTHTAERVSAVAHRIVHAGALTRHARIDAYVEAAIEQATPYARLHNPLARAWIGHARRALGRLQEVAVLDTAFFASMPGVASIYALPRSLSSELGIRRYGFHGLAHQSMVSGLPTGAGRRLVTLQLGSGCSAAAVLDGKPCDVSMGFSPSEGLMMATRAGDIDSGLILHLVREHGFDVARLEALLERGSGLLGVSGTSGDVREVLAAAARREEDAELAIELYCYRIRKVIGAYAAVLGGLDAIAFGGGVGERVPEVRARIIERLGWLGVRPAGAPRLTGGPERLTTEDSTVSAWVVPVDEATEMMRAVEQVLGETP